MDTGNTMQIGHQILRDLSMRFAQIEGQFNLLQWVDSQFSAADLKLDDYLIALTLNMQKLVGARRSGIFTFRNETPIDFSQTYNETTGGLLLGEIADGPFTRTQDTILTQEDAQGGHCRIFVRIAPKQTPNVIIGLEDVYFGRKIAHFYEEGFLATARMIAMRSGALIDSYISRTQGDQTQKVTKEFLLSKAPKAETEQGDKFEFTQQFDERWLTIVELFAGYFPSWAPHAFATPPLVQVLTTEDVGSKYIVLRATHGKWNVPYRPLERSRTICGLLLEKEEQEGPQKFLLVNPNDTQYEKRYASLLYTAMPHSELVIPIRDKNQKNKIVALINLEHPDENAFSQYHITLALQAAVLVSDFILYLIWDEEEDISDEKLFRYVMIRLIKRLSDTYLHKINNQIPIIKSSLKVLEKQKDKIFSRDQLQDFEDIRAGVYELSDLSKYFLANLAGFISFGKIHLADMVEHSVDDFDIEKIEKTENIYITIGDIGSDVVVFGSELIREHIYNIIKNSLDQMRIRNRKTLGRKGKSVGPDGHININISQKKIEDYRGRQASYELVRVSVQDDAGGIPAGLEHKVLVRGYTTKREIGGTGFGLSAAAEYMTGIGGYLELENDPGVGLTVHLFFPVYTEGYHETLSKKLNIPMDAETGVNNDSQN